MTRRVHFAEGFVTAVHEPVAQSQSIQDRNEVLRCVQEFRYWAHFIKKKTKF